MQTAKRPSTVSVVRDNSLMPIPFIREDEGTVSLYFKIGSVQSEMREDAPDFLLLIYTQIMMTFRRFNHLPRSIAMIGLGGGSMAKWCHRHLPHADITIVEINPHVIALRNRFYIPEDDHRFRVLCEDGADYVARAPERTDVLIVDGFNMDGQPPELCSQAFYNNCYRVLTASGLMVVNLCGDDDETNIRRISKSFSDQIRIVLPEDGNAVVFAHKGESSWSQTAGSPSDELWAAEYNLR
jgi:spermidine synthase